MASNPGTAISMSQQQQQQQRQKRGPSFATYGTLDTSSVQSQLWLSRLPPKLATAWNDAPEGTVLGTLTFTKGTPSPKPGTKTINSNNTKAVASSKAAVSKAPATRPIPQKLSVQVSEEFTKETPDLPLDYTLTNLTTQIPTLHPFTRTPNGSIKLHGTVARSCNLQMERTQRYRDMCKARIMESVAGKDKRFVKPVENAELSLRAPTSSRGAGMGSGFGNSIASFGKKMIDAQKDFQNSLGGSASRKRKFSENQTTKSILFELFSQERYWSLKELRNASGGRSEREIKAELVSIAEFRRAGEFKGMWELKSEFAADGKNSWRDPGE